ncbi:MAG: hypothetical protein ACRENU_07740 [Gemmatimonadaceae bacterium]
MIQMLRSDRIGIAATGGTVRCALVRSGRAARSIALPVEGTDVVATATEVLGELASDARRAKVVIALGPEWAQLRHVRQLPPLRNDRIARAAMSQAAGRFFLKNGISLATTGVSWTADHEGWSAAFEQPLVDALAAACIAVDLHLVAVVPLIGFEDHSAQAIARIDPGHPLAHRPIESAPVSSTRFGVAALAFLATAILVVIAPLLATIVTGYQAERQLRALPAERLAAITGERERSRIAAMQQELAVVVGAARSQTAFLGALAKALPEAASASTFRTDSAGGTLVVTTDRADEALAALRSLRDVRAVDVIGVIVREHVAGETRERVTLRFHWSGIRMPAQPPKPASR